MKTQLKTERGQAVVVMALFLGLVALGFIAFALDVGYLMHQRRMAQAAADAAAIAAAEEYTYGNTGNVQTAANAAATANGFSTSAATNPAVVTITYPTSGNYSNVGSSAVPSTWIKAVVTKPIRTSFLGLFRSSMQSLTIGASAQASGGQTSPTCICLEGSTGQDLYMNNNSSISAPTCGITDDSSSSTAVGMISGASICSKTLGTVSSTWDNSTNINNGASICGATKIVQSIASPCAPAMPAAPTYSAASCTSDPEVNYGGGATYSVGPGSAHSTTQGGNLVCYTSMNVGANGDTVTLNPGTYVITGGALQFWHGVNGHSNLGGNGVFFYLVNGASLSIANGSVVNLVAGGATESGGLTAPSTGGGTYNGILVYQDAGDTADMTVAGGASAYFNGSIYAPSSFLTLDNGSGSTFTAEIVAKSMTMAGGGTLTSAPTANLGTLNISVAKVTQ